MCRKAESDRIRSPADRVQNASREAYELAIDALHDVALQEALFRRLDAELGACEDEVP